MNGGVFANMVKDSLWFAPTLFFAAAARAGLITPEFYSSAGMAFLNFHPTAPLVFSAAVERHLEFLKRF